MDSPDDYLELLGKHLKHPVNTGLINTDYNPGDDLAQVEPRPHKQMLPLDFI